MDHPPPGRGEARAQRAQWRRGTTTAIALASALVALLLLATPRAFAQTPPTPPAPPTPQQPLPPGHPPVADTPPEPGATGLEAVPGFRRAQVPEEGSFEAADLPAGVLLVRVVDARGNPVADATVRVGSLRDGEHGAAHEVRTRADGVAQFERLETGPMISYRASVENDGARFSSAPFQLGTTDGERVQIVRYDVTHDTRALLVSEARIEVSFVEDRVVVVERFAVVNFSGMNLAGEEPHPVAYAAPAAGLRFALPPGYSAFRADDESMGDQHIVEENGAAVFHGSIPPTNDPRDPPMLVFQFREHLRGERLELDVAVPIPAIRAVVISQAPQGMTLSVDGMPEPELRNHEGQRILLTGRERSSRADAPLDHLHIVLSGLPAVAGPERAIAALLALAIVLGSIVLAGVRSRDERALTRARGSLDLLLAERARLIAEAQWLGRARAAGEVGPETHDRRRRELSLALARVLRELAERRAAQAASPYRQTAGGSAP